MVVAPSRICPKTDLGWPRRVPQPVGHASLSPPGRTRSGRIHCSLSGDMASSRVVDALWIGAWAGGGGHEGLRPGDRCFRGHIDRRGDPGVRGRRSSVRRRCRLCASGAYTLRSGSAPGIAARRQAAAAGECNGQRLVIWDWRRHPTNADATSRSGGRFVRRPEPTNWSCCQKMNLHVLVAREAAALGWRLAQVLLGSAGRHARDAVVGTPEEKALRRACRTAVERAVQDALGVGASDEEVLHLLGLVERLVEFRSLDELRLHGGALELALIPGGRERFDELGYDIETFPVAFDRLVRLIAAYLPVEVGRGARSPGSPLFGSVALDRLDQVAAELDRLGAELGADGLARFIPLAGSVEAVLDEARNICSAADRAFFTSDLLLALFGVPGGRVARCFDAVEPGSADRLLSELRRYTARLRPDMCGRYVPFRWTERADVYRAQQLAWQARARAVTDVHLLLGVLDSDSNTRRQLAAQFGGDVDTLRMKAQKIAAEQAEASGTPGTIWAHRDE